MGEPHHLEQIWVFKELREDLEASINSPKVATGSCDRRSRHVGCLLWAVCSCFKELEFHLVPSTGLVHSPVSEASSAVFQYLLWPQEVMVKAVPNGERKKYSVLCLIAHGWAVEGSLPPSSLSSPLSSCRSELCLEQMSCPGGAVPWKS